MCSLDTAKSWHRGLSNEQLIVRIGAVLTGPSELQKTWICPDFFVCFERVNSRPGPSNSWHQRLSNAPLIVQIEAGFSSGEGRKGSEKWILRDLRLIFEPLKTRPVPTDSWHQGLSNAPPIDRYAFATSPDEGRKGSATCRKVDISRPPPDLCAPENKT